MALLIEMVVDLSVNWAEFLQRLHASEPLHGVFSSSRGLMRILRAIVERTTDLVAVGIADLFQTTDDQTYALKWSRPRQMQRARP
jgi:hypothetical protein